MRIQAWMRGILLLGGFYNLFWFILLYYFGDTYLKWLSMDSPTNNGLILYYAIGVALIGLAMLWSIIKPDKYKWLILVAFIAKLLGGPVVYWILLNSHFTKRFIFHLLMNDLIWLLPLGIILKSVFQKK